MYTNVYKLSPNILSMEGYVKWRVNLKTEANRNACAANTYDGMSNVTAPERYIDGLPWNIDDQIDHLSLVKLSSSYYPLNSQCMCQM